MLLRTPRPDALWFIDLLLPAEFDVDTRLEHGVEMKLHVVLIAIAAYLATVWGLKQWIQQRGKGFQLKTVSLSNRTHQAMRRFMSPSRLQCASLFALQLLLGCVVCCVS